MSDDKPPIRFGIIGCARIASKLTRAINKSPNTLLHAIGSRSIEKAKAFAAANGLQSNTVKIYGSYHEVLEDSHVDVVYLPLPTTLHLEWAVLAAKKKKHLLLEKPTAIIVNELNRIIEACESNGVQFMDGTMWLHHPRTHKIKDMIDSGLIGRPHLIQSSVTSLGTPEFFTDDIRVKPDLDAHGALGDFGWYSIGAILWSKNYNLPTSVTALPGTIKNSDGVILSFSASLHYNQPDHTTAIIHGSFLAFTCTNLCISATKGSVYLQDFIIPVKEDSAEFEFTLGAKFVDLHIGWNVKPEKVVVGCEVAQEVSMVQEIGRIVGEIKRGREPERKWPEISRKTHIVLDAVRKSIDLDCETVYLTEESSV